MTSTRPVRRLFWDIETSPNMKPKDYHKLLVAAMAAVLMASCASPVVPVSAPTVPMPVRSPVVDVVPVSRGVDAVGVSNDALKREVSTAKGEAQTLRELLAEARAAQGATGEELARLESLAEEAEQNLMQIELVVDRQRTELNGLRDTVSRTAELATAANIERDNLRAGLDEANKRIIAMTGLSQKMAEDRDKAAAERDVANRWKWRFFWWAVGVTALVAIYVFLRLNPKTSIFVP